MNRGWQFIGPELETEPLVSIVVPVYNREKEIKSLLDSLKNQSYKHLEVIVVDNASSDRSFENATRELSSSPILGRAIRNPWNLGRQKSRNIGLSIASGEFVWFLDSDMIVPPDVVEKCVLACMNEGLDGLMICERSIGTGIWARCRGLEKRINDYDVHKMSVRFIRRAIALKIGGHSTDHVVDDYDFHNRAVRFGARYRLLTEGAILHKEVDSVGQMVRKYYRYAQSMRTYAGQYPKESFEQFFPLRSAYLKAGRLLVENPSLSVTFFVLKGLQYFAGFLGVVSSFLHRREDA